MKKYEGLFILNTTGKEEGIKEVIDKISSEIAAVGGKVDTVQKMEKKPFARVADRKHNSGFYVNIIFNAPAPAVSQLHHRFAVNDDVFRVLFTEATEPKATAVA